MKLLNTFPVKKQVKSQMFKCMSENEDYALEVESASKGNILHNLNFKLKKGEILGIAGLSGQGQVELLHALFGDGAFDTGVIKVNGHSARIRNEKDALQNGIVLVPEDRKQDGLILSRSIGENITLMSLDRIKKMGFISRIKEQNNIESSIKRLQIKTRNPNLEVSSLSGGNQQKVVISKALLTNAKIILMSDPTRGIDIGTKNEIYKLMGELAAEGYSILFYTTEMTELLLMCNRVLVIYEGRIAVELTGEEVTENNIIAQAIGIGGGIN